MQAGKSVSRKTVGRVRQQSKPEMVEWLGPRQEP